MSLDALGNDPLVFIPTPGFGEHVLDGTPCPTDWVWEALGNDGVQSIHRQLAEIIAATKRRFGESDPKLYGFYNRSQRFIDLRTNMLYRVGLTLDDVLGKREYNDNNYRSISLKNTEFIVDESLRENNYQPLKTKNHYTITMAGTIEFRTGRKDRIPALTKEESALLWKRNPR